MSANESRKLTERQFHVLCSLGASEPIPPGRADLSKPFVYDRGWGVFYVPSGHHQQMMATLLAWNHGCKDTWEVSQKLGMRCMSTKLADHWLETTPGACFKSSQKSADGDVRVHAARSTSLNTMEKRWFGPLTYTLNSVEN
jgi:hypothetical protein